MKMQLRWLNEKKIQNIIITLKYTRMVLRILLSQFKEALIVPILAEIGEVILKKKISMSLFYFHFFYHYLGSLWKYM